MTGIRTDGRSARHRTCIKAKIPVWSPNQCPTHRGNPGTWSLQGSRAAQAVLGHAQADVTQIYAERDFDLAATSVMRTVG